MFIDIALFLVKKSAKSLFHQSSTIQEDQNLFQCYVRQKITIFLKKIENYMG